MCTHSAPAHPYPAPEETASAGLSPVPQPEPMGPGGETGLRLDQSRSPLGVGGWDAESLGQWAGRKEADSCKWPRAGFGWHPEGRPADRPTSPLTSPPTPRPAHPGPFVALRKLYFTRRLSKFLLMMHLQLHHQSNEFGKYWVNKATGSSLLQDLTEPLIFEEAQ